MIVSIFSFCFLKDRLHCATAWDDYKLSNNQVKCGVISKLIYNPPMTKQEAIKLAGTQAKLADILGMSQGGVSQWKNIPQARIWQLMVLKPKWFAKLKK